MTWLPPSLWPVLYDITVERERQDKKFGSNRDHPDGTGGPLYAMLRDQLRDNCDQRFAEGEGTWRDILLEEIYEAMAESDPAKLRGELVQVAAVAAAWIEGIDRRTA